MSKSTKRSSAICVKLAEEDLQQVDSIAATEDRSRAGVVRHLLRQALRHRTEKAKQSASA